jgi:hypothetical protein
VQSEQRSSPSASNILLASSAARKVSGARTILSLKSIGIAFAEKASLFL